MVAPGPSTLEAALVMAQRRMLASRIAPAVSSAVLGAALLAAVAVVMLRRLDLPAWWLVLAPGAAGLAALAHAWHRRPTPLDAAMAIDRSHRLEDSVATAVTAPALRGADPAFVVLQRAAAAESLRRMDARRLGERPNGVVVGAAAAALALLAAALLFAPPGPPRGDRDDDTRGASGAPLAHVEQRDAPARDEAGAAPGQADRVASLAERVEELARDGDLDGAERALEELERRLDELARGSRETAPRDRDDAVADAGDRGAAGEGERENVAEEPPASGDRATGSPDQPPAGDRAPPDVKGTEASAGERRERSTAPAPAERDALLRGASRLGEAAEAVKPTDERDPPSPEHDTKERHPVKPPDDARPNDGAANGRERPEPREAPDGATSGREKSEPREAPDGATSGREKSEPREAPGPEPRQAPQSDPREVATADDAPRHDTARVDAPGDGTDPQLRREALRRRIEELSRRMADEAMGRGEPGEAPPHDGDHAPGREFPDLARRPGTLPPDGAAADPRRGVAGRPGSVPPGASPAEPGGRHRTYDVVAAPPDADQPGRILDGEIPRDDTAPVARDGVLPPRRGAAGAAGARGVANDPAIAPRFRPLLERYFDRLERRPDAGSGPASPGTSAP